MALHKVMHHSDEWLVVILRAVHYGAQHLQDVCTLGIGYILVGIFGTRRNQAQSHPEGAGIIRSYAKIVLLENSLAQAFPEFDVIPPPVFPHCLLQKQASGEFGKSLGEPLIMVRTPTYGMAPPLVGNFMRSHFLHEAGEFVVDLSE